MVKVDRQTKIERLKRNVEAVKRAFKKIFAFWGLDKVVVNNLSYFGIDYDEAKITEAKAAHDSVIKLLPNQIFVNDRKHHFCFNAFKKGNPGGKCRWRASMAVLYDGLNVPTSSVADICRRVIEIKGILEDDYGIKIDILNAEYSYMEIAYTLTSANQMPSRVVDLFMGLVSTKTQNITRISPSKREGGLGKTIPTIRVKNEGAKKTSLEYTFYDKTAECKQMRSGNGLPKEFEGIIYRFEQRIEKKKKIEEFFGTKSVFGDNPVTDGLVCRHIREHILETLVNNYAEAFMASINYASKILSEMPLERKKPGFALKLLNELKIREYEQHEIKIIDEEAFLYAVDSLQDPKNGGTKITAMIKHIEEYASEWDQREILRDPMVRMDGWELERFIWWMGYHLWLAIKYGLGVPDLPPEAEIRGEYSFCYGNCEEERKWKTFDRFRSRKRPHVKAMEERLKKYQSTISRKAA